MELYANLAAQLIGLVLCILILVRVEPALNRMGRTSPPPIVRAAFALLATGAVAGIFAIFAGQVPDIYVLLIAAGTAALTLCKRRIRLLTRIRQPRKELHHAQR